MKIKIKETKDITIESVLPLYIRNQWAAAEKPDELLKALMNSHTLITAWADERLVGLGNAISDGHLVVYYPHLLIMPEFQRKGIGRQIMRVLSDKYRGIHQQILLADDQAIDFYKKCGFRRAGATQPMWIYSGKDGSPG
jgi:GNAT superfamily N-acetyltransferase